MFENISPNIYEHTVERIKKKQFLSQSSNSIFLHCVEEKKINKANRIFHARQISTISLFVTPPHIVFYLVTTLFKCKTYLRLILPYVILVDEYYDSPGIVLRAQPVDYSIEVLSLGVSQDLLADCDTNVILRREGNETGDALKIEFQLQINCPSVREKSNFSDNM